MRFIENGPNIPDELLEARDKGEVVFICGAGVSIPAGLPNFAKLAKGVIEDLGVSKGHMAHVLLDRALNAEEADYAPPIDQIFNRLIKDYGGLVHQHVFRRLHTPIGTPLKYHKTILDLSSDANGNPRVITTNFDLLFETARKGLKKYAAPELPDFTAIQKFEGIVYLHGRLPAKGSAEAFIILSSSDFGRAYLSLGWAARFVRDLLQRYTVVLLGYSASDPPIRYLLEGLEGPDLDRRHKIFAFDSGTLQEVDARWRDRNVRGISYENGDGKHTMLWKSLQAWAIRANDPVAWRRSVLRTAKLGPAKLSAFQRGQVVSLVSSVEGAKFFADADVPAPAEWICVFDRNQRYAKPFDGQRYGLAAPPFDPLAVFGLDDDPPREDENESNGKKRKAPPKGIDVISLLPNEDARVGSKRISNVSPSQSDPVPARLFHLLRWMSKHTASPTMPWWVARQRSLHHEALKQIKLQLHHSKNAMLPILRQVWDWLIEIHEDVDGDDFELSIYDLNAKHSFSGWSTNFWRDLEKFLTPRLTIEPSIFSSPEPSFSKVEELTIRDLATFEVKFPTWHSDMLTIPDEQISVVFRLARRGLERASGLMKDVGQYSFNLPTFFPEDKAGEVHHDDRAKYLLWIGTLFFRLSDVDAKLAKQEFLCWPNDDEFHFDKLKVYALSNEKAFDSEFVSNWLLTASLDVFWHSDHRREFLILLKSRWQQFSAVSKERIVQKIIEGPMKWNEEADDDYHRRKAHGPLTILSWLQENECTLPSLACTAIKELEKNVPDWKPNWAKSAADSFEGRTSWVGENINFTALKSAKLSDVAALSAKHSVRPISEFTEYRPFKGLVIAKPFFAVSVLAYESRKGSFPAEMWREVFSSWPETTSTRLRWFLAIHISRIPDATFNELRHYIPSWIEKYLPELAKLNQNLAFEIWDKVLNSFSNLGAEATKSGIGESSIGGKIVDRSRRTFRHALGPVGQHTATLFAMLNNLGLQKSSGIPTVFKERIERLWTIPGEGADHALSNSGFRLLWLDHLDPEWAKDKLIPLFELQKLSAEPVWSGFLYKQQLPRAQLFRRLATDFTALADRIDEWGWGDDEQRQYGFLVTLACWWNIKKPEYLDWSVTRNILKRIGESGREHAISTVASIVEKQKGWESFGKPFFEKAWPQETSMQTSGTTYALVALAEKAGVDFPDVVSAVSEFVYPMEHPDLFIFNMKRGKSEKGPPLAKRFPAEVLLLLNKIVPSDQPFPPYDLSNVIEMIADSDPNLRQDIRWLRLRRLANLG